MPSLAIGGAELRYREAGAGEPVILVHSSACSSHQWRALSEQLESRYRVLTPDLYGYGDSEFWPGKGPLRLADEAMVIERLMALFDEPVHLVGHSYGGAVALQAALRCPESVKSLTLIEPMVVRLLAKRGRDFPAFQEIRALADRYRTSLMSGDRHGAMNDFVDYWNGKGSWSQLSEQQQSKLAAVAPKVALDFSAILAEADGFADCCHLDVPTLLICGDRSPSPTRRLTAILGNLLPGALVRVVSGAGHMLPITHGESVNGAIAEHLACYSYELAQAA